jgi:hypothetical protein
MLVLATEIATESPRAEVKMQGPLKMASSLRETETFSSLRRTRFEMIAETEL